MMKKPVIFFLLLTVCICLGACTKKAEAPSYTPEPTKLPLSGKVICVDAGHGINSSKEKEKVAPDSDKVKPAFVSGTKGKTLTEEELNLLLAEKLKKALEDNGATVYMTRTTHETQLSNIDRAEFANEHNAELSVKIHADGSENKNSSGISMLVPGEEHIKSADVTKKSKSAGEFILSSVIKATAAKSRGIVTRNDITGFNWSKVPVVLIEVGFMTNPEEDAALSDEEYQNKLTDGISKGIIAYFESNK